MFFQLSPIILNLGEGKMLTPAQHSQELGSVVREGGRNSHGDQRLLPALAEREAASAQLVKSKPGTAPPLE